MRWTTATASTGARGPRTRAFCRPFACCSATRPFLDLPRECKNCEVLDLCNGGCPKDRIAGTAEGEAGLNYLCPGLKQFYLHSRPYLQKLAWHRRMGESGAKFMRSLQADAAAAPRASRNDPCPCGSGRKYKKCCLASRA